MFLLAACGAPRTTPSPTLGDAALSSAVALDPTPLRSDFAEEILATSLDLDLQAMRGSATITLRPPPSGYASFEIGDLRVRRVTEGASPVRYAVHGDRLDVDLRRGSAGERALTFEYQLSPHAHFDGWEPKKGYTFLWPHFCGNLFPCKSDPTSGSTYSLNVTGVPSGLTAVYPRRIAGNAPSYMPAIAVGDFTKLGLGTTAAGTSVSVWYQPGGEAVARAGTKHLHDVFDFYERTYGPYAFGADVGSVSVDWPPGAFGGMEHHPYWHVATDAFSDEYTHAHEAAHGWFGDGVRIACWQDFVLSEGTASYLAAHALDKLGVDMWGTLACELKTDCTTSKNTIALPPVCTPIDLLKDPLWSDVPYMKGAFFYRDVAKELGEDGLDRALGVFYRAHVGKAARMTELIASLEAGTTPKTAAKIEHLADVWLSTLACPIDPETLCPSGHP